MQTISLLRKGLVVGIIVLLGINIVPLASSSFSENHQSIGCSPQIGLSKISDDVVNWTINGTMGNYGWYISPLTFTCTYNHSVVAAVYSNLGGLYTGPFTISDGVYEFYWYWVDYQGDESPPYGPLPFKIDCAPPQLIFTATSENIWRTRWLFNATVGDNTSGVQRVDFYVDDVLVGNATAFPYIFVWAGGGKTAQAIAYDMAGNSNASSIITPCIQRQNSPNVQQKTMLFQHLIYNLLLRYQIMVK